MRSELATPWPCTVATSSLACNPKPLASVFGVDSGAGTAVTDHGTSTPGGTGYLDADTESLRNVALATTGQSDRMTEAIEHGPTPFQQAMMEGLSRGY